MENTVSEVGPQAAFDGLTMTADAVLVDVRTRVEWNFVGVPDTSSLNKDPILLEWMTLPGMQRNADFVEMMLAHLDGAAPSEIYFLCRSGARSMQAAHAMAEAFAAKGQSVSCINVAEGFEGDLNPDGHRGELNGWKASGLPWRQS